MFSLCCVKITLSHDSVNWKCRFHGKHVLQLYQYYKLDVYKEDMS